MLEYTLKNQSFVDISSEEQKLYDYLINSVRQQSPSELNDIFRRLFIEGVANSNTEIGEVLDLLVSARDIEEQFNYILNRCCHILINHWQLNLELQPAIVELVDLFERLRPPAISSNRTSRKIRLLVRNFVRSEQYLALKRIARVIENKQQKDTKNVGSLIDRYPYLYEQCLLGDDSSNENRQTVRKIKDRIQHKFELDLSHYVAYQVRIAQIQSDRTLAKTKRIIQPVKNPTLLSDRELGTALNKFVGRVEGRQTYKDLSNNFINHARQVRNYKVFKDDFYEYIKSGVDLNYGNGHFNNKLYQKINSILTESNSKKPDEFLMLRTSSQLLNYLVVESAQNPQHYTFVDMITNLGATSVVGLLLKIVLMCRKVKPYLEKKFAILFSHYESFNREGVPWLVKAMENLNVALSVHFGKADVSCLKYIIN